MKTHTFIAQNYQGLVRWCHCRWNGSGEDVAHEAMAIALRRYKQFSSFRTFEKLCCEAARNLRISKENVLSFGNAGYSIYEIVDEKTRARAARHFAVAEAETRERSDGEKKFALRLLRADKAGQPHLWSGGAR